MTKGIVDPDAHLARLAAAGDVDPGKLTPREREIATRILLRENMELRQIADRLRVTKRTVQRIQRRLRDVDAGRLEAAEHRRERRRTADG